jgi:hypothetical protein
MKRVRVKNEWLQHTILRVASLLAPYDQRGGWLEEWRSELWYIPSGAATRFCLGAFRDALWLRRNTPRPVRRARAHLESPLICLAFLAPLSVASILLAAHLQTTLTFPEAQAPSALHIIANSLLFYLLLVAVALVIGARPGDRRVTPLPGTRRGWIFLTLKILLVLPILQCMLVVVIVIDMPFLSLGFFVTYVLFFRWVFTDQQRRCPVCLRLLAKPVRIGTPSSTFLEWYGAESMCARGHGVLHVPEFSASYSGMQQWLGLDDSWTGLFSKGAGIRQS